MYEHQQNVEGTANASRIMKAVRALLVARGGSKLLLDTNARTPLHLACMQRQPSAELIQILANAFPAACKARDMEHYVPIQHVFHRFGDTRSSEIVQIYDILERVWPESKSLIHRCRTHVPSTGHT